MESSAIGKFMESSADGKFMPSSLDAATRDTTECKTCGSFELAVKNENNVLSSRWLYDIALHGAGAGQK